MMAHEDIHQTLSTPGNASLTGILVRMGAAVALAAVVAAGLAAALLMLQSQPTAPYNLRQLLKPRHSVVSALAVGAATCWLVFIPSWAGRYLAQHRGRWAFLLLGPWLWIVGQFGFHLLWFGVPEESIRDIVGRPIWESGENWEMLVRFVWFYAGAGWWLLCASYVGGVLEFRPRSRWRFGIVAALLMGIAGSAVTWYGVVELNAADNVEELVADGWAGPFWLAVTAAIMVSVGVWLGAALRSGRVRLLLSGLVALLCGAFVAWWTVNLGLASNVEKYGLEYPAVRFLLGPNRGDLLASWQLLARWCVVYLGFVSLVAVGQIGAQLAAGASRGPHRSGFPAFPAWGYGGLWLLWLLLITYGSGFPFVSLDWPLGAAWSWFSGEILTPTRWDNGDMAVNTMMQVILGFLGAGMLWPRRSRFPKASAAIVCHVVVLGGLAIALGLEFMQVWLIHRTVSIHDVVCQTIGAGIGLVLWGSLGPELDGWLARMGRALPANRRALVVLILLMLAAYELYPYAPRFKAGYVWAKYRSSMVSLGYGGAPVSKMAGLAALQLLIYAPLGAAAALRPRARTLVRPVLAAGASCFLASGAFELAKILLPGRGTTLVDPCLAALGGMIGGAVSAGVAARKARELLS